MTEQQLEVALIWEWLPLDPHLLHVSFSVAAEAVPREIARKIRKATPQYLFILHPPRNL